MAKAYEYRILKPYDGRLDLDNLFRKFEKIASFNGNLGPDDFNALKAVYEEQISTVAADIFNDYNLNPPELSVPIRFALSPEQLDQLNANQPVTINLMEMGLFQLKKENIRIADITVNTLGVDVESGTYGSWATLELYLEHAGLSKLSQNGKVFQFTHYNDLTKNPLIWGAIYDGINKSIDPVTPSAASQSLLRSLLSRAGIPQTAENLMLYSRPAAWADLTISKDVNTSNGVDMVIDNLRLEVTYDFMRKPSDLVSLHVQVSEEDLMPLFTLDKADVNGLQDGRGNFYRTYDQNTLVTLKAPESYGVWRFEKWTDRFGTATLSTDPTLQLPLYSDQDIRAQFTTDADSASIVIKQGSTEILPGDLYNFGFLEVGSSNTVTFTIENPGNQAFTVHSIDLASSQFSINTANPFPFNIEANGSVTFELTSAPTGLGMYTATVSIPGSDPGGGPYNFVITGGEVFVATKKGTGLGTVMAGEIVCGPDCPEMLFPATTTHAAVALKAIAVPGYRFVRWEDENGTPLSSTIYAEAGKSVIAIFEKN
jgi:hypothetical protein